MTAYYRNGEPFTPEPGALAAFRALSIAAERIAAGNYRAQLDAHRHSGRSAHTFRFAVSAAHRAVVDAMPAVLAGTMTPHAAMDLLHRSDILAERLAGKAARS